MHIQLDDGVQFGLGLFETICLREKKPEFLNWHLERLSTSMDYFGINAGITEEEVYDWLYGQEIGPLMALKIIISEKNRMLLLRENHYTPDVIEKGFLLDYSKVLRNETSPLTYHKTINYGDNILEKRNAKASGIDEVVFLNSKGEICEGSTTNIFFVKDGKICTPKIESGLLPGVMRRVVLEKLDCEETIIFPEDVKGMEDCFVTNSLMGVMHVNRLFDKTFEKGQVFEKVQSMIKVV